MFEYIAQGNLNIRIHRDIEGEMWFGDGWKPTFNVAQTMEAGHGVILTKTLS